jgi:hypothetical protein
MMMLVSSTDVEDNGLDVSITRKYTIYKDVHAFTDRLKHLAVVRSEGLVREVFLTCLRSAALVWHSTELSDMEMDLIMTASLEQITSALIRRFKEHVAVAMQALTSDKFTLVDIRAGKNLRGFAQSMFRHAKAAEMTSKFN